MNNEEITRELEKLKFQVRTIGETIDTRKHPVESLILSLDWDEGEIDLAHDIFEKYDNKLEEGESVKWNEFEHELKDALKIHYQTVKSIVLAFYDNDQWTSVCYGYAMSFEPTTPVEFHRITRKLGD
ncbi:hypothetical protein ACYFX5_00310 [Bremerella sp. T1]|uniref:hypothetical protein n=1 Tax=Bremerella sp. TYQ1 TaxID=3119568 RepID=UPI001CCE8112|nr:hypothetical protein [Bremerella volcania]UBM36733.1 hypothetical protein LA756_02270 [Bremerella volcania]